MSDSKAKLVTANQEVVVERRKVSFVIAIAIVIVTVIVVVIVLVTKRQFLIVIVINCIIRCLRNIALVALLYIVNMIITITIITITIITIDHHCHLKVSSLQGSVARLGKEIRSLHPHIQVSCILYFVFRIS